MKRIYADERYCIGCRLCEVHCAVAHSRSKHIIKTFRQENARPRLRVEEMGITTFALQCRHCEEAPCLEACMTGAMHRDEGGAVICDEDRCVGCWMCVMVCPLGAIQPARGPEKSEKKVASKCDLCGMQWKDAPPCVANCPNEALKYEERPNGKLATGNREQGTGNSKQMTNDE